MNFNYFFAITIFFGLFGAFPNFVMADSFQPPQEVLDVIEKNYTKYEIGADSTCVKIIAGGELCAIAVDKPSGNEFNFREADLLLTYSNGGESVNAYNIFEDHLGGDAITPSIHKIEAGIWSRLRSEGIIFSLTLNYVGSSRVNAGGWNELSFLKLFNGSITKISNAIPTYAYRNENNGRDKFRRDIGKKIIVIKDRKDGQYLLLRSSVCSDDDNDAGGKDDCDNKRPTWISEQEVKFDDESMNFAEKSFFDW